MEVKGLAQISHPISSTIWNHACVGLTPQPKPACVK